MPETSGEQGISRRKRAVLGVMLVFALLALVGLEGYYIFVLHDRIERQSEELNHTSMQIQAMRHERMALEEELRQIKNTAGEKNDGNTFQRER